ncbi:MAG: cytochrome P460 family protein [Terriglobia bacterium]
MTTRTRILSLVFVAVVASLGALIAQAQKKPAIAYPAFPNDPRHWRHVKTMVIFSSENKLFERFGGLHNVYVNDIGWPAFKNGKLYPDGSMLALELYDISSHGGAIEPRGLKALYVMKKNGKLYPDTGGWGFEVFQGNTETPTLKDMKPCFDCHKPWKDKDYVKSEYMQ